MWPALMLANNRKHKVIGRTNKLIASTTLKKEARYQGAPNGKSLDTPFLLRKSSKTAANQKDKDRPRLKDRVVDTG